MGLVAVPLRCLPNARAARLSLPGALLQAASAVMFFFILTL
jgi:hypothetical protein